MSSDDVRYKNGREKLKEIDRDAGQKVIESLNKISPELAKYIIEYAFGDIYSRECLEDRTKEMAVVAALTAIGTAQPQLEVHINGALNTGNSINEIKEVILQMSAYAGFPSCINGMNSLKNVLAHRQLLGIKDEAGQIATNVQIQDRLERGKAELLELDKSQVQKLEDAYNDFSPDLIKFILEYGYADIFSRNNLNKRTRQIATIAALTALGNARSQLKFHMNAGLNVGLTTEIIKEIMLLMTVYAGFPAAINGINVLKEVMDEHKKE